MKKTAKFALSVAFILIVSSLAFGQAKKLGDTRWKLIEAERVPVTRSMAFIAFDKNARQMNGNTGCNIMNGPVTVRSNGRIDFGQIITTKRACKLMEGNVGEGTYLGALENARSFTRTGDVLRLYDRRGRKVLEFTRMIGNEGDERVDLGDRKWVLEQIKNRQTFVALPYAFVNFDERKHGVGGDSSCNVFGGEYSAVRNSIAIRNVISTMRACTEGNKMNVEREMLDGLRTAKRFEIRDERLFLYRGSELLLTFRGEDKY